jgi:hypothetical protein
MCDHFPKACSQVTSRRYNEVDRRALAWSRGQKRLDLQTGSSMIISLAPEAKAAPA